MKLNTIFQTSAFSLAVLLTAQSAHAAIALDRTRVIFNSADHSESLNISNQNKTLPYLAQSWIENEQGQKIESPLTALPPLQRVEPGAKSQVKVQVTGAATPLAQDRETLFYFNVREIPPKSSKPNTLQIALQTRVKMFYRPAALALHPSEANIPQKQLTLSKEGDRYRLNNPTGYYVTIVRAAAAEKGADLAGFKSDMVAPKGSIMLNGSASALGAHPVLTFINDYGGRPQLIFNCSGATCTVSSVKAG
ncbi:fimbria/pilus periplasmic chaperone [Erwinia billingiae]|jgi:P pilus assembly chaperone PapD|uniref:fimbria/pilus periplasmic chaperone n=1 Tax=Erwinia billingiae TaxID=182337 RepID=UPI00069E62A7|nr:fimbria/pilus periplasmic chaperone [Erwinia billingiae]